MRLLLILALVAAPAAAQRATVSGLPGKAGPAGPKGDRGVAGTAATVTVGTVTTLPAGAPATVANIGTASSSVLAFGIPAGTTGATGPAGPAGPAGSAATAALIPLFVSTGPSVQVGPSTTAEGSMTQSGVGSLTLPANFCAPGRFVEIEDGGHYSAATVAPGTVTPRVRLGGITVATATIGNLATTGQTFGFNASVRIVFLTCGTSGTVRAFGRIEYYVGMNYPYANDMNPAFATTTMDTTQPLALSITGQWSNFSSANILYNDTLIVRRGN